MIIEVEKYQESRDQSESQVSSDQLLELVKAQYRTCKFDLGSISLWIISSGFRNYVLNFENECLAILFLLGLVFALVLVTISINI